MKAILVQPPFVQLNAPYPAVHYLETFLRGRGWEARAFDHSIALYRRVFSRRGLKAIFSRVRELDDSRAAGTARGEPGEFELMLSYQPVYEAWIDDICAFLSGRDPALAHRLASAVELPRGPRAQAFLAERGERISSEEARGLATRILDDLGDFIAAALDPDFGTVRYAERIASSRADFDSIRSALDGSWIMRECYRPFLDDFWRAEARGAAPDLILISIPFPGCLAGALECARSARRIFGGRSESGPVIVLGGGYISTELRDLRDTGIFDFCDYLAFDAGYGSLASIIAKEWGERGPEAR
ncbi:MAG TPA: radical SAM protein, partial [Rectinemataceae bacterium]